MLVQCMNLNEKLFQIVFPTYLSGNQHRLVEKANKESGKDSAII